ncbi:MAG: hypothetical protein GKS06_11220 [Acidobacteria bacterium]|nr:hypothetical protein [Acidobacteriota bacterium]
MGTTEEALPKTALLVQQVNDAFDGLREDSSNILALAPQLDGLLRERTERLAARYMERLKSLAIEPGEASRKRLGALSEELRQTRRGLLHEAVQVATQQLERRVSGPFWFGERAPHLAAIQRIRASVPEGESMDGPGATGELRVLIAELGEITERLNLDEGSARVRVPLRIVFWSLPIIIGLWVSDRLSTTQNYSILALALAAAGSAYFLIRFDFFTQSRAVKWFRTRWKHTSIKSIVVLQLPLMLTAMLVSFAPTADSMLVATRMKLDLPEPLVLNRGTHAEVAYGLLHNGDSVALDVTLSVSAPGLTVADSVHEYNAVGSSGVQGRFGLTAPLDLPPGAYAVEFHILFRAQPWLRLPWRLRTSSYSKT